jgi:glycosyltransferase involved in cell wall biosynthesis
VGAVGDTNVKRMSTDHSDRGLREDARSGCLVQRVLIVRDRSASGGGIASYYRALRPYLTLKITFTDVGKPNDSSSISASLFLRLTILRVLRDWIALTAKILWFRPSIVHVNPGLDPEEGCRALNRDAVNILLSRILGYRILVFWRGWYNPWCGKPEFPGGNRSLRCKIYKLADAHIVLSRRFRDDLVRWGFRGPIHVDTTVVGDEFLAQPVQLKRATASRTDLLFLSRVEVAKGVCELLDVYQILKQRNPAYTLTIAGSGPDLNAIKERARAVQLNDIAFRGFITGRAKLNCYQRAGMFCFLSYTEGMPNAVLEAMAMGLPIVSSDAGGLRDILCEGKTGFIIQPVKGAPPRQSFNPVEVADAIERLARDPELYERISAHNAAYARDRFAAPKVAKRLEAIYHSVLGEALDEAGSPAVPAELVSSTESARL